MKKNFLFLLILLYSFNLTAQIGGLAASKLGTLCTSTVQSGAIEFEPFFGYTKSNHVFDENGNRQLLFATSDSTMIFSNIGFRFSYGVMENLEIGVTAPVDISELRFGAKYKLPFEGKLTAGLLAGYNAIIGNQIYVRQHAAHEVSPSIMGGIVMTYELTEKLSVDFDAQYQKHTQKNTLGHSQGFYINTDIGYYLLEKVNFIMGLNYTFQAYEDHNDNSHLLTLNTGIAIEKAEHFILVLNAPFDLFGKNEYQTHGFGLALTIMLD